MYPNFTPQHDTFSYWDDVEAGKQAPDEWQSALMNIVQKALDAGMYYNRDVDKYIKEHADFIPAEAWDLQYERQAVEGGIIGYEIYSARSTIRAIAERKANQEIQSQYPVGTLIGTLNVNGKKYTGLTVIEYKFREVKMEGKAGSYKVTVCCEPRNIEAMKQRAIQRGWRKS